MKLELDGVEKAIALLEESLLDSPTQNKKEAIKELRMFVDYVHENARAGIDWEDFKKKQESDPMTQFKKDAQKLENFFQGVEIIGGKYR